MPPSPTNPPSPASADADGAGVRIRWYFDFISPFAYLQHELLLRRRPRLSRDYRPVLLAGLLKHWDNKGPAEIPAKRWVTYQHCQWLAGRHGVDLKFPPAHPFNPLPALRLAIARGCEPDCITAIFRAIYADGADLTERRDWEALCRRLGVADGDAAVGRQWVKDQLRANTERAARRAVFGVPTLVIGDRPFWGADMTDMALEYLENPERFGGGEYRRLADLPVGQARKL